MFDLKHTSIAQRLYITSFPGFKYAGFLSQLFLCFFIVSLLLIGFAFLGVIPQSLAVKIPLLFLALSLIFCQAHLFSELKIKQRKTVISLAKAQENVLEYNLAEFLSLAACRAVKESIHFAKKMNFSAVPPEAFLYAAIHKSTEIEILLLRLGIDVKKLKTDIKNFLEKSRSEQAESSAIFSQSFQEMIAEAASIAQEWGSDYIEEKEIILALAKQSTFFKTVLVDYDLKEADVENSAWWFMRTQQIIEKNKQFWTKENLARLGSLGKDFASGFTVTLDQFGIDWRKAAQKNVFWQIVGHTKEVQELEVILTQSGLRNALIVGDEGVGRKSIIEALAHRCYTGAGSEELKNKRVVELDMVALLTRIKDQELLESTLDDIFQEALAAGNVILVIDQLDNFVNQKTQKPGDVDISVILGKYLAMENFQFVGITSFGGLHRKLEQNPSFVEYFRKIEVSEISEQDTLQILQNTAMEQEHKHKILIIYPAIREIVNLTARYLPSLPFPKKALDVLSEAVSLARSRKETVVMPRHIAEIISDKTQIPLGKMEFKEKSVLLDLEKLIHQRIVGQEEAVSEVSIAMRRARAGIASKKRPMGSFLFLGPTGVGKTETAKALSEIYFGGRASSAQGSEGQSKMIRLDMSEFQAISDIPRLIGQISPVEQQGLLTTPVRENPFSLVLLDEIEKAHPNILNLFLQVFDEGHITDGQGRKVMFTNTIIICTSNAGAPMIFKAVEEGQKLDKQKILASLFDQGTFRPELINRFDAAVIFHPLSKENLLQIAQLMLLDLAKNLKEKEITFTISDELKEKIVELSYKPEFGAREMRRVVQDKVENNIAEALISDTITKGDSIEINPETFEVVRLSATVN